MIRIKYVQLLGEALFLNGKNLGLKLDAEKTTGLDLFYNRDKEEVIVYWQGKGSMLPKTACNQITPYDIKDFVAGGVELKPTDAKPALGQAVVSQAKAPKKVKAQVWTPTGHVTGANEQ